MPITNGQDQQRDSVYVLARALCRDSGTKVSRKDRLTLALVELRDHIQAEFVKVAKGWQVTAQELRRDYSYAYPVPALGEPDALCLEKACDNVIVMLHCDIATEAEQSGVPSDVLEVVLVDWLSADLTGRKRTPPAAFIKTAEEAYRGLKEDRLPSAWKATEFLHRSRSKAAHNEGRHLVRLGLELKSKRESAGGQERRGESSLNTLHNQ